MVTILPKPALTHDSDDTLTPSERGKCATLSNRFVTGNSALVSGQT